MTNETAHYSNYITRRDKLARHYLIFKDAVLSMQFIFITNVIKIGKQRIIKVVFSENIINNWKLNIQQQLCSLLL